MDRPGRGFEDLERKGVLFSIPLRLAGVGLLGPTAFLYPPSNSTNVFSSCQGLMAAWLGPVVAPQGPSSHASPPFDGRAGRWAAVAILAKASGPGLPGNVHLLPSLAVVVALGGTLCASRPAADWL